MKNIDFLAKLNNHISQFFSQKKTKYEAKYIDSKIKVPNDFQMLLDTIRGYDLSHYFYDEDDEDQYDEIDEHYCGFNLMELERHAETIFHEYYIFNTSKSKLMPLMYKPIENGKIFALCIYVPLLEDNDPLTNKYCCLVLGGNAEETKYNYEQLTTVDRTLETCLDAFKHFLHYYTPYTKHLNKITFEDNKAIKYKLKYDYELNKIVDPPMYVK
jgi:hypothetical protein